jgi:hypothetical protein
MIEYNPRCFVQDAGNDRQNEKGIKHDVIFKVVFALYLHAAVQDSRVRTLYLQHLRTNAPDESESD